MAGGVEEMPAATIEAPGPAATPHWRFLRQLCPQTQLLLCCARATMDPGHASLTQELLNERIDWQRLLRKARQHHVLPLLCKQLSALGVAMMPEPVLKQLRTIFAANRRRNAFLAGELIRIVEIFERSGIPAIPFKGPALAVEAYGDLSLRQFGDLDIIVPKEDVARA